jgi:hypothetical protein
MKAHEEREWYEGTHYGLWRRSKGDFINVSDMGKFHLIKAAQKLVRIELTDLDVYDGIREKLNDQRKDGEVYDFELGGAL